MFSTLQTFDTKFSADSVEWCPIDSYQDLFVCGTYQLSKEEEEQQGERSEKKPQKRLGKIFLFRVLPPGKLNLLQEIDVPAVLDMKWAHVKCQENILLGVVNSIGYLQIYKLLTDGDDQKIELLVEKELREVKDKILALSLDWNTGRVPSCDNGGGNIQDAKIVVSDSEGWVTLFSLNNNSLDVLICNEVHKFEGWITAFNYWDPNIVYSGGDDCKLHRLDTRIALQSTGCTSHEAGVTSLHSNASDEFCLASGGYDEILRLWDTRNFRHAISETNLTGGIWRLKWDPFHARYLFAACMYGGFSIVDCQKKECPKVIEEYNEHESIAYGCDWGFLPSAKITKDKLCPALCQEIIFTATCSFYDHTLKLQALNIDG